ncbi:hypothetical protein [Metallosphaera cuprina]|uniref:Uncharacterized protein n=1 Tax=Metallosphaera cuprina (strain Ar-4) TaxID=1006006 RepID=F4G1I8_METCR|nr:hypothetical protein [Metallosphaera cuprina]AEB94801.1 hypothetical protein Mcup_0696 [Metallosphaera cuprina Ar-4]
MKYIAFLPEEGSYVKKLEERIRRGEKLTIDSPSPCTRGPGVNVHERPRTALVSREISKAIRKLGYT